MKSTTARVALRKWCLCLSSATLVGFSAPAETNEFPSAAELKRLSLEELMNEEITIVSRRETRLSGAPSSVQVVMQENIHRSGATSLPEALRLAPNLQVAQVSSAQWAISARGFNNTTANKLLVMIDGRTVYTPLFAGVFWDVQNLLLEDVDRIEVVSGPGATLWGANAVNGVINIVSKNARDTQGLLVEGAGGSLLRDYGAVRYGGSVGSNLFYRVYGLRFDRDDTVFANGRGATNAWDMTQGGFRMDWYAGEANHLTVQGDVYAGSERSGTNDTSLDGQNLLGRWTHTFFPESGLQVQLYVDRTWRRIPGTFAEDLRTYDLDFQHYFPVGDRQSVTWGGGYRLMQDEVQNSARLAFLPRQPNLQLFSGFLQDEISLIPERLNVIVGTKVEHNDFSGLEVQPSIRLAWLPDPRHVIWAAVSRAVRSPSRIDRDLFVPGTPPFTLRGGTNFTSEKVLAYEIGYRVRPAEPLSFSLATFFNQYDDIRSVETNGGIQMIRNGLRGQSWGAELSAEFEATDRWRLRGGYTYFHKDLWTKPGRMDLNQTRAEGNDPQHQAVLQSMLDLPLNFQFDITARYVDALPAPPVPGYFTFDARLAWRFKNTLEISLVGQNLWDDRHPEFGSTASRQEIPRSVYGKVTLTF